MSSEKLIEFALERVRDCENIGRSDLALAWAVLLSAAKRIALIESGAPGITPTLRLEELRAAAACDVSGRISKWGAAPTIRQLEERGSIEAEDLSGVLAGFIHELERGEN